MFWLNKIVWFLIIGLRPLFGPIQCRFAVTCTEFAHHQLTHYPFFTAVVSIARRFLSCNPLIPVLKKKIREIKNF